MSLKLGFKSHFNNCFGSSPKSLSFCLRLSPVVVMLSSKISHDHKLSAQAIKRAHHYRGLIVQNEHFHQVYNHTGKCILYILVVFTRIAGTS